MSENLDLFGDPIPENWGMRGRPQHVATAGNALKVKVLLANGWSQARIGKVLGISVPTLKQHYFSILQDARHMRDRLVAAHRTKVFEKAMEGDSSALRLLWQMTKADELEGLDADMQSRRGTAKRRSQARSKLGKKEQAELDAMSAGEGSDWGDDLNPSGGNSVN